MSMGSKCDMPNLWVNAILAELMSSVIESFLGSLGRIATFPGGLAVMSSLAATDVCGEKSRNLPSIVTKDNL